MGVDEREVLRRRVAELEAGVAARDDFITVLGHELRNTVAPAVLAVEQLEGVRGDSDRLAAKIDVARRALQRFVASLDRISDVSRLGSGRIELALEPCDLAAIAGDVCAGFAREAASGGSTIVLSAPGDVVGQWDRLRVEQIVRNLVSNAVRFGAGQPVEVAVSGDDDTGVLSVTDHGVGIAPGHHDKIFARGERINGHQYRGGFGVGLWVVRTLCTAMGGQVAVDSELGRGARFTVRLPRA